MDKTITEDLVDFIKLGTAATPPGAAYFFGLPLQEWMYIASIVASLFFILDKAPTAIGRIYGKFKKQDSDSCDSCHTDKSSEG